MDGDTSRDIPKRTTKIELISGEMFDPLNPDPSKITLDVIAKGLANSCRFGGQVPKFYSIAQHSVLVAVLSPSEMRLQRCAILHDGDETLGLPDMPTPLKSQFPEYVAAQKRIGRCIDIAFSIEEEDHRLIKPADQQALMIEKMRLKDPRNMAYWGLYSGGHETPDWIRIDPLTPEESYQLIMEAIDRVFEQNLPIDRDWLMGRPGFYVVPENAIDTETTCSAADSPWR